jgi:hypothetical protein
MTDMAPASLTARLRLASARSDLRISRRLDCKLDMSAAGITSRLRKVEALRRFCLELVRIGERNGLGRARRR